MDPGGGIDQQQARSAFPALALQFVDGYQVIAGSRMLDQLSHAAAAVVLLDRGHNRFAFGFGLRKPHGIRKFVFWNIDGGLHDSKLLYFGFRFHPFWMPHRRENGYFIGQISARYRPNSRDSSVIGHLTSQTGSWGNLLRFEFQARARTYAPLPRGKKLLR
jgi:hypothetical protein